MLILIAYHLLLWVILGSILLILTMRLVSRLLGGIDFGDVETTFFKGAVLVLFAQAAYCYTLAGVWLPLAIWIIGLTLLFRPGVKATALLAFINWVATLAIVSMGKPNDWPTP